MIGFNVRADVREVTRMLSQVQREIVPQAASTALNKTAANVRVATVRDLARALRVKGKTIGRHVAVSRSNKFRLRSSVLASEFQIPLVALRPRQTKRKTRPGGVYYKGRAGRGFRPHAFVVKKFGGRVFARTGATRLPIAQQFASGEVVQEFVSARAQAVLLDVAGRRWPVNFERELKFRLGRLGGAGG